jgi:hypothetical protein
MADEAEMIRVYDLGPQPPVAPVKPQVLVDAPKLPPGAEGDPSIEPETRRYAEQCRNHLRAVETFDAERAAWERESGGGAVEIGCNFVDGGEMLERGQGRYVAALPPGVELGSRSGTERDRHSY